MEPEIIGILFALYRIEAHITREKPRRDDWLVVKVVGTAEMILSARPMAGVRVSSEEGTITGDQSSSCVSKIEEIIQE